MAGFYAGFGSNSSFSQASLSSQAPYVPNFPIPYSFAPINPYTMFDPNLGMPGFSIGNGNGSGTILICQLCKKIGHGAKTCITLSIFGKGGYNGEYDGFSRNTGGNGSGTILICQLCKQIGHGAKTCRTLSIFGKGGYNGENGGFSRNTSGNGSGTILICQLCKKIGHGAKTCSTLSTFQQGNTLIGFPNQHQENLIGDASALIGHERDMHPAICCIDAPRPDLVGVKTDRQNIDRLASFNQRTGLAIGDNACSTELILGRSYGSEGKFVKAQKCRSSKRGTSGVINFHTTVQSDDRNVTPLGVTCDSCNQIVDHTGKHSPFDGLLKEGETHEQHVDLMDKQVSQFHITLEEKEQLIQQYKEREKNLEEQITENRTLLTAAETRIVEDKKKYDLMLGSNQLELSRHLKDISQRNDQAISDIQKKYEVEKLEIVNMEKQKAAKLVGETERDDLFLFHRQKKKNLELQCSRTVARLYLLMMLLFLEAYSREPTTPTLLSLLQLDDCLPSSS